MEMEKIKQAFLSKGIDLGEYGQVRTRVDFSSNVEGHSSPIVVFLGVYMNYLTVSLSSNSLIVVEPFKRKIDSLENIDQAAEECVDLYKKLIKQAEELSKII